MTSDDERSARSIDPKQMAHDVQFLETLRWGRKEFTERICANSHAHAEEVLSQLRSDAFYQLAEYYYLLKALRLESVEDLKRVIKLHNDHLVTLSKDAGKLGRLGLTRERLLDAMFTADTLPRVLQNWRENPGAIDQSNLGRLLVTTMSAETCRKVVVAGAEAGFLRRHRTSYGTVLVVSNGRMERIFGECLRDMRRRVIR
jgi:hypothetical protein